MTCKVNADTTNGLKLESDTSGEIDLQTNGTTKVHMDSSGNVGIGTSSPDQNLHVSDTSTNAYIKIISNDSNTAGILFGDQNSGLQGKLYYLNGSDAMRFDTNGSERMRINSSGDIGIGTTSPRNELTVDGIISGITVNTSSGNSNTTIKSGMSGAYLAFVTWNNGSGYATLHVSTALSGSGQIIASSNSSGGNNAFDVSNSFSSNSGNGIALFINGTNLNLQTKDNWSANAHPIRISLFGG